MIVDKQSTIDSNVMMFKLVFYFEGVFGWRNTTDGLGLSLFFWLIGLFGEHLSRIDSTVLFKKRKRDRLIFLKMHVTSLREKGNLITRGLE